jgi:hypothetical protein
MERDMAHTRLLESDLHKLIDEMTKEAALGG